MKILFLDANILFAATLSKVGASRMLFLLSQTKQIKIVSSHYALEEAKRNLEIKIGKEKIPDFFRLCSELSELESTWTKPSDSSLENWAKEKRKELEEQRQFIEKYKVIIVEKDIPILYSAQKLKVDFLVTLDKKDFMSKKMKATKFPFKILTPGEFLQSL